MPTYEYQCQACGHTTEYFQSVKEPPRTVCPKCNGELKRLVSSGAGLIFKGSGFYETDYKKKSVEKPHHSHISSGNGEKSVTENDNGDNGSSPAESKKQEPSAVAADSKT